MLLRELPIYIDIDGTLTDDPIRPWGKVLPKRIAKVRQLLTHKRSVVLWSGRGTSYATEFAKKYEIVGAVCIGKPALIVDDNPDIRPRDRMKIMMPGEFFK